MQDLVLLARACLDIYNVKAETPHVNKDSFVPLLKLLTSAMKLSGSDFIFIVRLWCVHILLYEIGDTSPVIFTVRQVMLRGVEDTDHSFLTYKGVLLRQIMIHFLIHMSCFSFSGQIKPDINTS